MLFKRTTGLQSLGRSAVSPSLCRRLITPLISVIVIILKDPLSVVRILFAHVFKRLSSISDMVRIDSLQCPSGPVDLLHFRQLSTYFLNSLSVSSPLNLACMPSFSASSNTPSSFMKPMSPTTSLPCRRSVIFQHLSQNPSSCRFALPVLLHPSSCLVHMTSGAPLRHFSSVHLACGERPCS